MQTKKFNCLFLGGASKGLKNDHNDFIEPKNTDLPLTVMPNT